MFAGRSAMLEDGTEPSRAADSVQQQEVLFHWKVTTKAELMEMATLYHQVSSYFVLFGLVDTLAFCFLNNLKKHATLSVHFMLVWATVFHCFTR